MAGTYNGSSDFLKWYKQNYSEEYDPTKGFTKKDGMSDGDYGVGQQLYQNYVHTQGLKDDQKKWETDFGALVDKQKESIANSYAGMRSTLEQKKNSALQAADITYERLKRYLPMQAHVQGKSGLGATASTGLQAYNRYINETGSINKNYSDNMRKIGEEEAGKLSELENYRTEKLTDSRKALNATVSAADKSAADDALDYYRQWQEDQNKARNDAAQAHIDAYSGTDPAELEAWLKQHYGITDPVTTVDESGNEITSGGYTPGTNTDYDTMLAKATGRVDENVKSERLSKNTEADAYIKAYGGTDQTALETWLKQHYGIGDDYASGGNTDYDTMLAAATSRVDDSKTKQSTNEGDLQTALGNYTTAGEKLAVLEEYKGRISDAAYNSQLATLNEDKRIEELVNTAKGSNPNNVGWQEGDNAADGPNERVKVRVDGEVFTVRTGNEVKSGDVYAVGQKIDTGKLFVMDGKIYIKNTEGNVYEVVQQGNKKNSFETVQKALGVWSAPAEATATKVWRDAEANSRLSVEVEGEEVVLKTGDEITSGGAYEAAKEKTAGAFYSHEGAVYYKNKAGKVFTVGEFNSVNRDAYEHLLKIFGL